MNHERYSDSWMPPAPESPRSPESRERVEGQFRVITTQESQASRRHPGRIEDAVLGSLKRILAEAAKDPDLAKTKRPFKYLELIREAGEREAAVAERLAELGIDGVFDGVSGGSEGLGEGMICSRLVAAEAAERLAEAPLEFCPPEGQAEATKLAFASALLSADLKTTAFNRLYPDMAGRALTTALLSRVIAKPDGKPQLVVGYCGNTRAYCLRSGGLLEELTIDDTNAGRALRAGETTREQYEHDTSSKSPTAEPEAPLRDELIGDAGGKAKIHTEVFDLEPGDTVFLMTDGVHRNRSSQELTSLFNRNGGDCSVILQELSATEQDHDDASLVKIEIK
jgi:serine/threonine protein phosphatase PrpC